jgi:GT2 family glycosyltransferase
MTDPGEAISVVLVTRDRRQRLAEALTALADASPPPAEIVVVDNGSSDGTREMLSERFPAVRVLRREDNLGVARSRNLGIAAAASDRVVCIDDDAVPAAPDFLAPIARLFSTESEVVLVAGRVVDAELGVTLAHEFPRRDLSEVTVARDQDVAYFVGCAFAVRRAPFLAAGGFYEALHYGLEELDLAYRLLDAGWRLRYSPEFAVLHRRGSAGRGAGWHVHLMRSRVLVALRSLPWWALAPHLVLWHGAMLGFGLRSGQLRAVVRGAIAGWRDAGAAWSTRHPISPSTVRKVRGLAGRILW